MPLQALAEGLYYLAISSDSHPKQYLGVKHEPVRDLYDVVVLPVTVTPEKPGDYGPTKVSRTLNTASTVTSEP